MEHSDIVNWLIGETCFFVEDIDNLQQPLKLEVPASMPKRGRKKMTSALASVYNSEFIYVITSDENRGISKIGRSRDPQKRVKGLQTGSPYKLHLEYSYGQLTRKSCIALESRVHKLLHTERMSGEWFNLSAKDAILIIDDVVNNATITPEVI